jgi:uncharacterized membrane protein YgcG
MSLTKNVLKTAMMLPVFGALFFCGFIAYSVITSAKDHNIPIALSIEPSSKSRLHIQHRENITFTAFGKYPDGRKAVKVGWKILNGDRSIGTLKDCRFSKQCTFEAGDTPEVVDIEIKLLLSGKEEALTATTQVLVGDLRAAASLQTSEWAVEKLIRSHQLEVILGMAEEEDIDGEPTRGHLITLVYRVLRSLDFVNEPLECEQYFSDIPQGHPAYNAACLFYQKGWAISNVTFNPNRPASRGIVAAFMGRIFGDDLLTSVHKSVKSVLRDGQRFPDVPSDHMFFEEISIMDETEIMTGYNDGTFGINDPVTHRALSTLLLRILNHLLSLDTTQMSLCAQINGPTLNQPHTETYCPPSAYTKSEQTTGTGDVVTTGSGSTNTGSTDTRNTETIVGGGSTGGGGGSTGGGGESEDSGSAHDSSDNTSSGSTNGTGSVVDNDSPTSDTGSGGIWTHKDCPDLSLALVDNSLATYAIGESVTYTYSCNGGGPVSYLAVYVLKPDGSNIKYNSAGNVSQNTLGFGTANLATGIHTIKLCFEDSCTQVGAKKDFNMIPTIVADDSDPLSYCSVGTEMEKVKLAQNVPDVGDSYARIGIPNNLYSTAELNDPWSNETTAIRNGYCTRSVYEDLMNTFCAYGNNRTAGNFHGLGAYWYTVMHDANTGAYKGAQISPLDALKKHTCP